MFWLQHMMGFGWGGWILGGLVMLLFWGGLIAVAVFAIRAFSGSRRAAAAHPTPPGTPAGETPLDILKRRYALGEIDKDEFDARRRDIEA